MQILPTPIHSSLSPYKLFQQLWKAIEVNNCDEVHQMVDSLVYALQGNQSLATRTVMELIDSALRHQCVLNIKKDLTRLPGFVGNAPIKWGGPMLIPHVKNCGDMAFASYLKQQGAGK